MIFYEPEGPRDSHSHHPTQFAEVAERFQRAIKEQRFPRLGIDAPGRLTISGGLATFPWDGLLESCSARRISCWNPSVRARTGSRSAAPG